MNTNLSSLDHFFYIKKYVALQSVIQWFETDKNLDIKPDIERMFDDKKNEHTFILNNNVFFANRIFGKDSHDKWFQKILFIVSIEY